jgi:hypothetical protein
MKFRKHKSKNIIVIILVLAVFIGFHCCTNTTDDKIISYQYCYYQCKDGHIENARFANSENEIVKIKEFYDFIDRPLKQNLTDTEKSLELPGGVLACNKKLRIVLS